MNIQLSKPTIGLIPKQEIQRINPVFTYTPTGTSFDVPGFLSVDMKNAQIMNTIAQNNRYQKLSHNVPKQAEDKDLIRLLSESAEDSQNRAVWINPKDSRGYYLLREGEDKNGNTKLRILNENGLFVKNATIQPKTVILTDIEKGQNLITEIGGFDLNHTDFIEILARRFNPFAIYETIPNIKDESIKTLSRHIPPNTSCISASYGVFADNPSGAANTEQLRDLMLQDFESRKGKDVLNGLSEITKRTRFLASSGNNGDEETNIYLLKTGCEGVGGFDKNGSIHENSSSRHPWFTQHYEPYSFYIHTTEDGINISGLKGTDLELETGLQTGQYLGKLSGTSYSTPVRAAKLALNDMMKGIL